MPLNAYSISGRNLVSCLLYFTIIGTAISTINHALYETFAPIFCFKQCQIAIFENMRPVKINVSISELHSFHARHIFLVIEPFARASVSKYPFTNDLTGVI